MEEAATQGQTGFDPRFSAGVCKQVPTGVVAVSDTTATICEFLSGKHCKRSPLVNSDDSREGPHYVFETVMGVRKAPAFH